MYTCNRHPESVDAAARRNTMTQPTTPISTPATGEEASTEEKAVVVAVRTDSDLVNLGRQALKFAKPVLYGATAMVNPLLTVGLIGLLEGGSLVVREANKMAEAEAQQGK